MFADSPRGKHSFTTFCNFILFTNGRPSFTQDSGKFGCMVCTYTASVIVVEKFFQRFMLEGLDHSRFSLFL